MELASAQRGNRGQAGRNVDRQPARRDFARGGVAVSRSSVST